MLHMDSFHMHKKGPVEPHNRLSDLKATKALGCKKGLIMTNVRNGRL